MDLPAGPRRGAEYCNETHFTTTTLRGARPKMAFPPGWQKRQRKASQPTVPVSLHFAVLYFKFRERDR
jgi:hypothetical protein